MPFRPGRLFAVGCLVAIGLVTSPAAQAPPAPAAPAAPAQQPPTFRGGVDSISVDAIVTDRQGRPVTDLTAQDFEIREAGRAQQIDTFRLVQIDDGYDDNSAQRDILSASDHEIEVQKETNRLLVIFLDDYHTRAANSLVIREKLANFVMALAPHDLVAIAMPLTPSSLLTFSRNHEAIAGQIMNFMGRKYNYTPMNALEFRYSGEPPAVLERMRNSWTMLGLRSLCEYMGTLKVGRKSVLYVSEGMSNTLPSGVLTSGSDFSNLGVPQGGPDPTGRLANRQLLDNMELTSDMQRVFGAAARANVSIYPMDPRGLAGSEYSLADAVSAAQDKMILSQTIEILRTIADQTDGRAIINRNDPLPALKQMVRDGSTYYLLGYQSSSQFRDGRFHEIQVRVKRQGLEVRARKGYWAVSAEEVERATAPKPVVAADVTEALDAMATTNESGRRQPVTFWMGASRGASEKASVSFVWEANQLDGREPSERPDHLTVTAYSIYGDTLYTGRLDRDPAAPAPGGLVKFDAPAGEVRVKVEIQNAAGRRLETTDVTLDVPDFTSTSAQITTPFVYRGRTARDLQAVRASATAIPTASRAFSRVERLLLRFDAYGPGGTVPAVTMKILNKSGASVATMPAPTKTTGNSFETEFTLGSFPPGDYLLELSADANGNAVKKLVAIRVTG